MRLHAPDAQTEGLLSSALGDKRGPTFLNRTVKAIVLGLSIAAIMVGLLPVAGVDLGIHRDDRPVLSCLLLFLGFGIAIWCAPAEGNPRAKRIVVWVLTVFSLWGWGFPGLIDRTSRKAILIFSVLAVFVVSEWRYLHLDAAQRNRGLDETDRRNILVWLATVVSLVLLWALIRLVVLGVRG